MLVITDAIARRFAASLTEREYSPATISKYAHDLRLLMDYAPGGITDKAAARSAPPCFVSTTDCAICGKRSAASRLNDHEKPEKSPRAGETIGYGKSRMALKQAIRQQYLPEIHQSRRYSTKSALSFRRTSAIIYYLELCNHHIMHSPLYCTHDAGGKP